MSHCVFGYVALHVKQAYHKIDLPLQINDPNVWQPLSVTNPTTNTTTTQKFATPQWGLVKPFALRCGSQFNPPASDVPEAGTLDYSDLVGISVQSKCNGVLDF